MSIFDDRGIASCAAWKRLEVAADVALLRQLEQGPVCAHPEQVPAQLAAPVLGAAGHHRAHIVPPAAPDEDAREETVALVRHLHRLGQPQPCHTTSREASGSAPASSAPPITLNWRGAGKAGPDMGAPDIVSGSGEPYMAGA